MAPGWINRSTPAASREYVVVLTYRDVDVTIPYYVLAEDMGEAMRVVCARRHIHDVHAGAWVQEVPWQRPALWMALARAPDPQPVYHLPALGYATDWFKGAHGGH